MTDHAASLGITPIARQRAENPSPASELTAETRYRLLLEISHRTRGTLDLDRILNILLDSLGEHLDFDAAGVFVLRQALARPHAEAPGEMIDGVTWRGFAPRTPRTDPMLREGKGIVGHVIRSGEPVLAQDVRTDPHYIEGRPNTRSEIAAPIKVDDRVVGALNLESDRLAAFDEQSVEVLRFYAEAAAIAVERAVLHEQLVEARRMDEQMRVAQEVQRRLLPSAPPRIAGYDLAAACLPSSQVGGDYFDFIPGPNGTLTVTVADVSGHGVPAAMLMSSLRTLTRTHLGLGASLLQLARALNDRIPDSMVGGAFVSAFFGVLSPRDGTIAYVNCGHPPPLQLCAGGEVERLDVGGPLLGIMEDARFEVGTATIAPGESLLLYTDGLAEVTDRAGRWREDDELGALACRLRHHDAPELIQRLIAATRTFKGTARFDDDVTLVVVKRRQRTDGRARRVRRAPQ